MVDLPVQTILVHHACTVGLRSPVQCLSAVPICCVWASHSSDVTHEASHGTHAFARTIVMDMDNGKDHSLGGVDYKTFRVHLHLQSGATDVYAVYGNEKHALVRAHTKTTACMCAMAACLTQRTVVGIPRYRHCWIADQSAWHSLFSVSLSVSLSVSPRCPFLQQMPKAYQHPVGNNIAGVPPIVYESAPAFKDAQWDSWLTVRHTQEEHRTLYYDCRVKV